jgi:hypothetical protein
MPTPCSAANRNVSPLLDIRLPEVRADARRALAVDKLPTPKRVKHVANAIVGGEIGQLLQPPVL